MPLLTVVITGRDDGYMPDFRYRLRTTLEYFAHSIALLGCEDEVEVLFVDWGSEVELSQSLPLSGTAARLVHWLFISEADVRSALGGENKFHNTLAFNAGLRRSTGEYVAFFPADAILPTNALKSILSLLKGEIDAPVPPHQALFFIARAHVPWQFVSTQPTVSEWDRYLWLNAWSIPLDPETAPSVFGGAAAFLLHRDLWFACGGLDERLGGWGGSDIDLGLRLGLRHPWLDLSVLGVRAYHMEHSPGGTRWAAVRAGNKMVYNQPFRVNGEDWGLRDAEITVALSSARPRIASEDNSQPYRGSSSDSFRERIMSPEGDLGEQVISEAVSSLRKVFRRLSDDLLVLPRTLAKTEALLALACSCHLRKPASFLDIGAQSTLFPSVVSAVVPYASIQCLAPDPPEQIYVNAVHLHFRMQHSGYMSCVLGEPESAIPRAFAVTPDSQKCAAAIVPCGLPPPVLDTVIKTLLERLDEAGFLLIQSGSEALFEEQWLRLQRRFPHSRFMQCGQSGCVGLIDHHDSDFDKSDAAGLFRGAAFSGAARAMVKEVRRYRRIRKMERRMRSLSNKLGWTSGLGE